MFKNSKYKIHQRSLAMIFIIISIVAFDFQFIGVKEARAALTVTHRYSAFSGTVVASIVSDPFTPTAGDIIWIGWCTFTAPDANDTNINSFVSDNQGHTYILNASDFVTNIHNGSDNGECFSAYTENVAAVSTTITAYTFSNHLATSYLDIEIATISGAPTSSTRDTGTAHQATGVNYSPTSGTFTTNTADTVIMAMLAPYSTGGSGHAITPNVAYTQLAENENQDVLAFNAMYRIVTSATSYTADWALEQPFTGGGDWDGYAVAVTAFKSSTPSASSPVVRTKYRIRGRVKIRGKVRLR